ncbi:hypothetical protein D9619_009588 [Psilocybe cf. subviscida]|uniref:Uncharacterized protein n=1 Tax=Psilocybe cf. subviscida TaxID=2480587 RepID=A0A8H5F6S9_9AGAR|nr:hypothetical protein D9619_009588 [Psilocybe cf. subviscida]
MSRHNTAPISNPSLSTATVNMLEVPLSGDESTSPTKKKITRIPLFGRSRKKSNQSASSSPFVSSCIGRESSERGDQSSISRGPSVERPSEPALATPVPPLPVPNKSSSSSLGSKFAARFSHSRSKAVVSNVEPPPVPAVQPSGLYPPSAARAASFESSSSVMSKSRSTTPRPSQPAITVSLSPDDDERFKDLFTKETPANSSSRTAESRNASDPDASTPSTSPVVPSKEPSIYRRGFTPASAIAASVRHRHTASNERPPSTASKASRKNSESSEKGGEDSGNSTPRLSDAQYESPRPLEASSALEERGIPASLTRRSSIIGTESVTSALTPGRAPSVRSRMKSAASSRPSKPPTMPLPLPPSPSLPSSSPPNSPTFPRLAHHMHKESISSASISSQLPGIPRTRAQTISGGTNSRSSRMSPSLYSPTSPVSTIKPPHSASGSPRNSNEAFDVNNASADQLRQRLRARDKQYDELALYVEKLQKAHKREVDELLGRISTMEKDTVKLEKQIQGFMWMINENTPSQPKAPSTSALSQTRPSTTPVHESEPETGRAALSNRTRSRIVYNSDSGADSQAESLLVSGASGSESMTSAIIRKRIRRPYPVGDGAYVSSRAGSILRPTTVPASLAEKGLPDIPNLAANAKRTSVSSISVSPSSSTSSLLPPSPSITMSSLTAIPEGPPSALRPPHGYASDHLDSDRRARLMANRISTSSMASSVTAASSSYSANVKRSRPPSIAQVLDTSQKDNNILDKLRPFSYHAPAVT